MPDNGPTAETLFTLATALTNLVIAALAGRAALRKAKEGKSVLEGVADHSRRTVSAITNQVDKLSEEVATLSDRITQEFRMFNERFKEAQGQLTLVLRAIVRERRQEGEEGA